MNTYYRLYAKFAGQKQFKPLDLERGCQVTNLIYATLIPEENIPKVNKIIEDNKETQFEIRKVS